MSDRLGRIADETPLIKLKKEVVMEQINQNKNRMVLLLRNSTKKQTEKKINESGKMEYDIPLQRDISGE